MASVTLKNVVKYYRTSTEDVLAVKNFNLNIFDGELMVLLGPSGCGKSTIMRMIAGLEKITEGEIFIGDRRVNDLSPKERNVAMAFETYALYTHLSAYDNLAFCLRARGMKNEAIRERVQEIARILHIEDILDKRPSELSGGEQQRLSLGRAMVRNPNVFLLDEPLSHLDAKLRTEIRAEIRRLHSILKTTMIYVTHDQREALALADRIAVMNFGELQQVGTPKEVFDRPANLFVATFLGEPTINIINGTFREEDGIPFVQCEKGDFRLPLKPELADMIRRGERSPDLLIGIRPQDISIRAQEHGGENAHYTEVPGLVKDREFLGEKVLLTTQRRECEILSVHGEDINVQEGEPVVLLFNLDKLHFFEQKSGISLR